MRLAGKSRLVSVTIIVSCFLNIVLTWIFLYVLHLGIRGAAIATIICAIITKIPYIPYLISGKFPFRIVKTKLSTYFEMIWLGVKRGSPNALNDIVMSVIFFATNGIVLNTQGVQGMFIWSVTLQLLSWTGMISMGLTLTEKILNAHIVEGEPVRGQEVGIHIDQTLTQDATGTIEAKKWDAKDCDVASFAPKKVLRVTGVPQIYNGSQLQYIYT